MHAQSVTSIFSQSEIGLPQTRIPRRWKGIFSPTSGLITSLLETYIRSDQDACVCIARASRVLRTAAPAPASSYFGLLDIKLAPGFGESLRCRRAAMPGSRTTCVWKGDYLCLERKGLKENVGRT